MIRLAIVALLTLLKTAFAAGQTGRDAFHLHRANNALTQVIVHDIFSPPAASRIYTYAHIAAHEVLARSGGSSVRSLREAIPGMPVLPAAKDVDMPVAAVQAFLQTGVRMIFSEKMLQDSMEAIMGAMRSSFKNNKRYQASVAYGNAAADSIILWASSDKYRETRAIRRYSHGKGSGVWIPTPPAYMAAVEPYWGRMRPMLLDSASAFRPPAPMSYSTARTSAFFRQAIDVYHTTRELSDAQKEIALFWDCNPFFVNINGHLAFASKKLSPGGHWMSIAGLASRAAGLDLAQTSSAYVYTALALYDGFISCWDEKFRSNYIRPETFINAHIDESWRPLLQTPPFPEYTSGHSVISTAAAVVLAAYLGDRFSFSDDSEIPYGLPVRDFSSFSEAAREASLSRMYGGIHFRQSIVNGQDQGRKVGERLVKRLEIRLLKRR